MYNYYMIQYLFVLNMVIIAILHLRQILLACICTCTHYSFCFLCTMLMNYSATKFLSFFMYLFCINIVEIVFHITIISQPRWLSGLKRSRVHSLMIAHRSLCPEKLGSNPGQGSKGINFSGWHGLNMSVTVTKRR